MKKNKVLIVEDESIVALGLKKSLEKIGFEVTNTANDYNTTLNSVRLDRPDIILMDINLNSNKDGIEITKRLQKIDNIPVIYTTAFSDDETIERAIKTNPVSYLLKPYNEDELKSNIMLGLYKSSQVKSFNKKNKVKMGADYYYDFINDKLFFKDMFIKLSAKEKVLLKILIKARGNFVEFDEIRRQIWTAGSTSESALRTLIYRLRSKLAYDLVETIPNVGCRLHKKS